MGEHRWAAARVAPAATLVGVGLGAVVAVVGWVRRAKPLHPVGEVYEAELVLDGAVPGFGPLLGPAGTYPAVVRLSSGGGLPRGWPDVQGLALRWSGDRRPNDVLLSSTGLGPVGRFVLRPRRRRLSGPYTSLMPFRGPVGPVLLAAVPGQSTGEGAEAVSDDGELVLLCAGLRGPWHVLGSIRLSGPVPGTDRALRFEPVHHCPPGLTTYPWAAQLRVFAYRWARAAWPVTQAWAPAEGVPPGAQTRPGSKASA